MAIFLREGVESPVEGLFCEMKMTQNWERRWAGREVFGCSCSCLKVDDELESNSDDEKREGCVYQQHVFHVCENVCEEDVVDKGPSTQLYNDYIYETKSIL
jgi:hypothetical protein